MSELARRYGAWAIIAGGSEGIGLSFARQLAAEGIHLILLARNAGALEEARAGLSNEFDVDVEVHALDLTGADLDARVDAIVGEREIGLLVYNAGAQHGAELFLDAPLEKAQQLIRLNCLGPATLCHRLGAAMRERGRGGLLLVSSMSALAGSAYVAAYSAAKAFEINLAEGLWAEMKPYGVDVLCLVAGATETPAMARCELDFGAGAERGIEAMKPEDVATEGLRNLGQGPVHIAGEGNRAGAEFLRADRRQAIELLSSGAAGMFNKPFPIPGRS